MTLHRISVSLVMTRARHVRKLVTRHAQRVEIDDMSIINKQSKGYRVTRLLSIVLAFVAQKSFVFLTRYVNMEELCVLKTVV